MTISSIPEQDGLAGKPAPARALRAQRTREKILNAAHEAFAGQGFSSANIEAIAASAGVNKRMVYHHFGDKDGLFLAVLEAAYGEMRRSESKLALHRLTPVEGFKRLIAFTFSYYLEHPDFLALVTNENLCGARHIRASARIEELGSQLKTMVADLLKRGQAEGVFRNDIDPAHLWISIAATSWFYIANTHTISVTFGRDMLAPAERKARLQHMTDLILSYINLDRSRS